MMEMLVKVYGFDHMQALWEEWIAAKSRYIHERNGELKYHQTWLKKKHVPV